MKQMNLFTKQKYTHRRSKLMIPKEERGRRDKSGIWD